MAITEILQALKSANTDLVKFYLKAGGTDLETQVLHPEGAHKRIDHKYDDYPLKASISRVGSTGRNWDTSRSVYIAFDLDHVDDHENGFTTDKIQSAIRRTPSYANLFWSRRGKGITGVVSMDAPSPDRESQIQLGMRLKLKLESDGFPVEMVDCIGQNSWVFADKVIGKGHQLIREASSKITLEDLPEIENTVTQKVDYSGSELTTAQSQDIQKLQSNNCIVNQIDTTLFGVHTCDLHLIDPEFRTNSPGTNREEANATISALPDGSWKANRYNNAHEHPSWTSVEGKQFAILNRHSFEQLWEFMPDDFAPISATNLTIQHPTLSPPLIDGLCRVGETVNVIAAPKTGKSWMGYSIALAIATGGMLWGHFCKQGRVLIIDNELPSSVIASRIPTVAATMGVSTEDIDVITLRGRLLNLEQIGTHIVSRIQQGQYSAIILDAWYRVSPGGAGGENDNSAIAQAYNTIDQYAVRTGATWFLIHHTSKGDQSNKSVTDVGAGAGSQSRAADTHIILRPHEQANHVVLDAVVRSFPPPEPVVLKWEFPLFTVADDVDPTALADAKSAKQAAKDKQGIDSIITVLTEEPLTINAVATATGMGRSRTARLLSQLSEAGEISHEKTQVRGNNCLAFTHTG